MTNEEPRLTIDKRSPALWAVTFANPPINLIDAAMIGELQQLRPNKGLQATGNSLRSCVAPAIAGA